MRKDRWGILAPLRGFATSVSARESSRDATGGAAGPMDALVFSGLWVGMIAAGLARATAGAIPGAVAGWTPLLAASGAVVVYCVDRLRDVDRDRSTRPHRSAFIEHHRPKLLALTGLAAALAAWGVLRSGLRAFWLCATVFALGLLHRRLKRVSAVKWAYVTGSWVAITVGLPVLAEGADPSALAPALIAWPIAVLGATIGGNLVASDLRPGIDPFPSARGLWLARGLVGVGVACGALAPMPVRSLVWIPIAELICLARFRRDERYGLFFVDGALLAGALLALATQRLAGS